MTTQNHDIAMMPAAFIGHGSPMNALENNQFTQAWAGFAQRIPKPKAILVISAHWYIDHIAVTAMPQPNTIHDFYGFPPALSEMLYPAPGNPLLARRVAELLSPMDVRLDQNTWGLDHGAWSVLAPMFPEADVPVIQLSINARLSFDEHVQLGAKLAPLRNEGVLILASGNVVHNLRLMQRGSYPWAQEFDDEARNLIVQRPQDIAQLLNHPAYKLAVPTPDHFIPLLYIAGLAAASGEKPEVFIDGIAMGSISMTSFALGK
ncbi:4,5-DOPA dioxygenase extradiol [Undibacterium sp. Dicai25W]|uniref:4,5-DOPA-extradiol-dioxygenase n=1 Tax=Undibacterium sp. Dicai25W TaxID=3413034 RepID=UPI003BF34EAD